MRDAPPDLSPELARRRACGLALLEASRAYETHTVPADQPGETLLLALVGRARRLLRAAYNLADDGLDLEAAGARRGFLEYVLLVRWILEDPDNNLMTWQRSDAWSRLLADDDARKAADHGWMTDEMRQGTEALVAELTAELEARGKPMRVPSFETLAPEPFVYLLYRFESQVGSARPGRVRRSAMLAARRVFAGRVRVDPRGAYKIFALWRAPHPPGQPYLLFAASRYRGGGLVDETQPNGATLQITP